MSVHTLLQFHVQDQGFSFEVILEEGETVFMSIKKELCLTMGVQNKWRDAIWKMGMVRKAQLKEKNVKTQRNMKGLLEEVLGQKLKPKLSR